MLKKAKSFREKFKRGAVGRSSTTVRTSVDKNGAVKRYDVGLIVYSLLQLWLVLRWLERVLVPAEFSFLSRHFELGLVLIKSGAMKQIQVLLVYCFSQLLLTVRLAIYFFRERFGDSFTKNKTEVTFDYNIFYLN